MCARFTLRTPASQLMEDFAVETQLELKANYNVAPTDGVAVCRLLEDKTRELAILRWGLVPPWAKDPKIGSRMINARAETVATKPSFRTAFKRRRCLVLADGYFEWKTTREKKKQPYYIRLQDGRPFAFAGLWENCAGLETCTIITTQANDLTAPIHDRMPVIVDRSDYDLWLDSDEESRDALEPLLVPYDSGLMVADPVSTYVNNVRNKGPQTISPADPAE